MNSTNVVPIDDINHKLESLDASGRVRWMLENLPGTHVLSSSFGIQGAVMLHLLTRHRPDIPVIVIDTGYLFPETYGFIDQLCERFDLNLHVARPSLSAAWLEARYGKLWEKGEKGIDRYNRLAKVEPMKQMLAKLGASTWFSGLRRTQSDSRADTAFVEQRTDILKVHPIADWSDSDSERYLDKHDLPWHPLREKGYVSVGDTHTTQPLEPGMREEDTRFFGIKRECGLHFDVDT